MVQHRHGKRGHKRESALAAADANQPTVQLVRACAIFHTSYSLRTLASVRYVNALVEMDIRAVTYAPCKVDMGCCFFSEQRASGRKTHRPMRKHLLQVTSPPAPDLRHLEPVAHAEKNPTTRGVPRTAVAPRAYFPGTGAPRSGPISSGAQHPRARRPNIRDRDPARQSRGGCSHCKCESGDTTHSGVPVPCTQRTSHSYLSSMPRNRSRNQAGGFLPGPSSPSAPS